MGGSIYNYKLIKSIKYLIYPFKVQIKTLSKILLTSGFEDGLGTCETISLYDAVKFLCFIDKEKKNVRMDLLKVNLKKKKSKITSRYVIIPALTSTHFFEKPLFFLDGLYSI